MSNRNTITVQLQVKDDGSVVMKQFGKHTEDAMKKTETSSAKAKASLGSLKGSYLALTAAVAAFTAASVYAVRIVTASVQAFMEQEAAEMRLAVAMGNAGTYTRENLELMKDYAAQLQQNTKYGDEMTLSMMANLQTYGMDIATLKEATKATQDLAAAKGMDLTAASELVGKAFVGETGTLARYGIVLSDNIEKSEKFSAVLAIIQQRFGGSATAELETYAGQWAKIKNWWGDMAEKVGIFLLKTLELIQLQLGWITVGFLTMLEKIAAGVAWLSGQMEKIPKIGDSFKGLTQNLNFVAHEFENAKESALGFVDTNLKMLTSFDRVGSFADKIYKGKKGSSVVNPLAGADKEAQDLLKSWTDIESRLKNEMELAGLDDLTKALVKNEQEASALITKYGKIPGAIDLIKQAWESADREAITSAENKAADEYDKRLKEQAAAEKQLLLGKMNATRDIYTDLRGYEDSYYAATTALIDKQAEQYRDLMIDEVAVTVWAEEEKRKARLALARTVEGFGSFGEGFQSGLVDWRESLGTEFSRAEDMAKTTATAMSSSFSNMFFDAAKGEFDGFRSYFDSFMDEILRKATDTIANMVTQWILGANATQGGSSGLGGIIGFVGTAARALIAHSGGVVGTDSLPARSVPSYSFASAPRYHGGFAPDEYPAVLKKGEGVFTPAQMANLKPADSNGGKGESQIVNQIYCWDSRSLEDFVKRNQTIFQNVNTQGMRDNKTRSEMKRLLG